jgi:hypothetical protein
MTKQMFSNAHHLQNRRLYRQPKYYYDLLRYGSNIKLNNYVSTCCSMPKYLYGIFCPTIEAITENMKILNIDINSFE